MKIFSRITLLRILLVFLVMFLSSCAATTRIQSISGQAFPIGKIK